MTSFTCVVAYLVLSMRTFYVTRTWPQPVAALPATVTWGVHNSYSKEPSWIFRNHPQPNFPMQHAAGARLFEVDVYWWMQRQWIVAHVPVLDEISHVSTLKEAVCTLRVLPGAVMFLDVKQFFSRASFTQKRALLEDLSTCSTWGPLTVLMDVSCLPYYNNVDVATFLARHNVTNTSILYRGVDWWWLRPSCTSDANAFELKARKTCEQFQEPDGAANMNVSATSAVLYECGKCADVAQQMRCVRSALERPSTHVYVQTQSWVNGTSLFDTQ